ncbi:hypothetical protein DSM106972_067020 [Dulcicalothrix desertica PCC 7102]|uniref:site-specific DNA-methyltransferase (adenine-specific) n=1 Tax=Dulcicalothrix desertica PCC 7102 TaxID=232991 RepID=A0A3S1AIJ2_9CYAN|nr:N-6 DNA methylase [Dulcicalothrix desertica]RUT01605.1 hypothetical protein DSM106972_067020 [Dulcicalothrix desertica PCC 7102]
MSVAGAITAIQIEGNLLASDMTSLLATGSVKGQQSEDFGLAKTDKLADEIAVAWGDGKAYWAAFQRKLARLQEDDTATTITREWAVSLLESLGYKPTLTRQAEEVDGLTYAISHRAEPGENKPPIHIIGCRLKLDQRPPSGTPRLSAHGLVQEYLNKTEHLWAITTNGYRWRLLRDSSLMTRLSYIEFDLEQILNSENFAEFGLFYRLFHRSRLPEGVDDADKCLLEFYHQETLQQGGRVRDKLRDGVEEALRIFGNGFIQHPDNQELRQKLGLIPHFEPSLTSKEYYSELLRLIYRLLFLMVAEGRELLLIGDDVEKARIYREYYSVERLRRLAEKPRYRREGFQDLWQGLCVTFKLFDENWRGQVLGLSPLNGALFGSNTLPDIDKCVLDNYDLLQAIKFLSLYVDKNVLRRVNYAALDVEELGSIYESLLDFQPQVKQRHEIYEFALVYGSERKTTGAYYTPQQLVNQLIKTTVEPVIEEKLRNINDKNQLEKALLSLKIIDISCGSGHCLLAAARRISKELARIRTGESEPGKEPLNHAIRDVIRKCIYGVDINPLAVDLCKVSLWIEGFYRGLPLHFLDHRIKCGNSLIGVLEINCLYGGIPDEAYKAVTGDNKQLSIQLKKRNKKEKETDLQGQLSIFSNLEPEREQYGEIWRSLDYIDEETPNGVRQKEIQYFTNRKNSGWWRDYSACNLWTAAFFTPLTDNNLQLLPTTAVLSQLLQGNLLSKQIVDTANKLAEEKHFFHWPLEFPEVFQAGGFDCVLGNTPWERIKLQEKEFFSLRDADIANAVNKAAREKLIKNLPETNPMLAKLWEDTKHFVEAQAKFIRESGRFPLTAVGDINTYAVFAETARKLISYNGRVGIYVPTGIATDDTCKKFFGDLTQKQVLASLYDFENREGLFSAIDRQLKFSLISITAKPIKCGNFAFFLTQPRQLENPKRQFKLSSRDIALLNPNTLTCPVFRTRADTELTIKIYQHVPVLENESTGYNPWSISFMRMFDMANDSGLFKNEGGNNLVPLYEAKMFHQYDHRWATYNDVSEIRDLTDTEKIDTNLYVKPRYWIEKDNVENTLGDKWKRNWFLCFRRTSKAVNQRTSIFNILPKIAVNDKAPIIINNKSTVLNACLLANCNSLVFDYSTRQKIGGVDLSFFILKQLPVLSPESYTQEDIKFIVPRVLELVYTAWDMQPFAQDMGYNGEPFIWDSNRRALLRADLDAYYAKLYGLTRDELRYILDPADVYGADFPSETFRVLKNNEIKQFGEYRTQRLVLEAWDRMFGKR